MKEIKFCSRGTQFHQQNVFRTLNFFNREIKFLLFSNKMIFTYLFSINGKCSVHSPLRKNMRKPLDYYKAVRHIK